MAYHVTARTNNREQFYIPLNQVWAAVSKHCFEIRLLFGVKIHALVLMNNHLHMLITTPEEDMGVVMQRFMKSVTETINLKSGRTGHVFRGRYHWTLIGTEIYFSQALKYVYRNPVKAGVCPKVEDYPFSTLRGLLGFEWLPFPLYFPFGKGGYEFLPGEYDAFLKWLNRPFFVEHEAAIQKALKKTQFLPPKRGWKRSEDLNDAASINK